MSLYAYFSLVYIHYKWFVKINQGNTKKYFLYFYKKILAILEII
ncbi:MAG: hypothetical protein RHS_5671 [Robinsoniella sp. RHS]|nr:MAG: hypothetical protein RHS_5671 [Robinsoniella sp. RHS]